MNRSHEPRALRGFGAEAETNIDGDAVIIEEHHVEVGHVAAVFPSEDAA
jgi:hypothetical protein